MDLHSVENRENRRRAPSGALLGGTPPPHDLPERTRLTSGGDPARSAGAVWTEVIVHAYVRDCERRGCRPTTITHYLGALRRWPDRWPDTVADLRPTLAHLRELSPASRRVYRVVWRRFGRFGEREYGLPNVPAELDLAPVEGWAR